MSKRLTTLACAFVLAVMAFSPSAVAHEKGDWLMRFGATYVNPKSNNHPVVSVDGAWSATFNFSYFMADHWAVELLAAYPFEHDITLNADGSDVASTKHLPPTLNLQYHFVPDNKIQPYIGIGVNYTNFFDVKTKGALAGTDLDLGSSWGIGGQLGVDIKLNDKWFLNADVRYIDIETKAKLDGASLGTVKIDPWVYGLNVGFSF